MSKYFLWLTPWHFKFLLKYYIPFVVVLGLAIFFGYWFVWSGHGWDALAGFASFVAGVASSALAQRFLKGKTLKRDAWERLSSALPHPG